MASRWIIFYIELGSERLEERMHFPSSATGSDIQQSFERWKSEKIVSGWWKEETYKEALALMQRLAVRNTACE